MIRKHFPILLTLPLPLLPTPPGSCSASSPMSPPSSIPISVQSFFAGSGGINVLASPLFLTKHTGKPRVYLPLHDIYHAGKDKENKPVYTVYRILAKEYKHNTIQGMLCVSLVSGYGVKDGRDGGRSSSSCFMRPNDLKKLMTEGTTSIKRNSVVVFQTGMVVRLEDIEIFCDLPIINRRELIEQQSAGAVCKRDMYKATRGEDNWAHVKQGALIKDMERSLHQLLLPYYRRYRDKEDDAQHFFRAFMEDLIRTCTAHHTNFTVGCDFDGLLQEVADHNRKRSFPSLQTETRPRKKWGAGGSSEKRSSSEVGLGDDGGSSESSAQRLPLKKRQAEKTLGGGEGEKEAGGDTPVVENDPVKRALKNVPRAKLASIIF